MNYQKEIEAYLIKHPDKLKPFLRLVLGDLLTKDYCRENERVYMCVSNIYTLLGLKDVDDDTYRNAAYAAANAAHAAAHAAANAAYAAAYAAHAATLKELYEKLIKLDRPKKKIEKDVLFIDKNKKEVYTLNKVKEI